MERFEFGLLNRRPSFRSPEWVNPNFRSFSLRGKGLEGGCTGTKEITRLPPPDRTVTLSARARPHARTGRLRLHGPGWRFPPRNMTFRRWTSDGTAHAEDRDRISQGGHRGQTDADGFLHWTRGHLAPGRRSRTVFLERLLCFRGPWYRWCRARSRGILLFSGSLVRLLLPGSLLGLRLLRAVLVRVSSSIPTHPRPPDLFRCVLSPLPLRLGAVILPAVRVLRLLRP